MQRLFVLLLALAALGAKPTPSTLDRLKAQFPPHVAGPVTAASDPAVQRLFLKYRQRVNALTLDTLAERLLALRREAERDLARAEKAPAHKDSKMNGSQRHATRQNAIWLRQKFLPFLDRLTQFQRGRGGAPPPTARGGVSLGQHLRAAHRFDDGVRPPWVKSWLSAYGRGSSIWLRTAALVFVAMQERISGCV